MDLSPNFFGLSKFFFGFIDKFFGFVDNFFGFVNNFFGFVDEIFWICWQNFLDLLTEFFEFVYDFFCICRRNFWICWRNFLDFLTIFFGFVKRRPEGPQTRSWGPEGTKLLVSQIFRFTLRWLILTWCTENCGDAIAKWILLVMATMTLTKKKMKMSFVFSGTEGSSLPDHKTCLWCNIYKHYVRNDDHDGFQPIFEEILFLKFSQIAVSIVCPFVHLYLIWCVSVEVKPNEKSLNFMKIEQLNIFVVITAIVTFVIIVIIINVIIVIISILIIAIISSDLQTVASSLMWTFA